MEGNMFSLASALALSSLFVSEGNAAPVVVGQTIGLSKKSESYQVSEELIETLSQQYAFEIALLTDNSCSDTTCQQKLLSAEDAD